MMSLLSWILVLTLELSAPAFSQSLGTGPYTWVKPAVIVQRMTAEGIFAFGGVGYAGVTSEGEKDFRQILTLPPEQATDAFEKLYAEGNSQAKSYALAGLRKLDRARFEELRASLESSTARVQTMRGCIISDEPLREVAEDLAAGKYDSWMGPTPRRW
jgi:hypothetical protein